MIPELLVRRSPLALAVAGLVLVLSGCLDQPEEANDNGPQPQPDRPTGVVSEPEPQSS